MKGIKISLIVILSAIIIGLCGIMAYGISGRNVFRNDSPQDYRNVRLVLEKEVSLDGIDSISILYGMNDNDIYLYESDDDAVTVKEYSSSESDEKELSTIKVEENSLEVRGARRNHGNFGFHLFYFGGGSYNRHYTEVYLPASYHGELLLETSSGCIASEFNIESGKDCSISSSSGDIDFLSVTADNVSVDTSSGYVTMENIDTSVNDSVGVVSIKTSSGDVNVKGITGETQIESSSGYLSVGTIEGDVQLKTSSGDMVVNELTGGIKTESSSGNVFIETLTGSAQLKTSSGDISIQYIDGNIQAMSTSGYVRVSEGSGDRTISTSSGDITVGGTEGGFQINTQSGDAQITINKGGGSIETTSGDVQLGLEELTGTLNVSSSSGYVSITLSAGNEFEFTAETSSGDIKTFFDDGLDFSSRRNYAHGTYGANAQENRIEIRTTSGDVSISKVD